MSTQFRSKFESMVFQTTGVASNGVDNTSGSVYTWMQELHPSQVPPPESVTEDKRAAITKRAEAESLGSIPEEVIRIERGERMFRKKLETEHLFEMVVMYLFNGLTPHETGPRKTNNPGTMELVHYMAYLIPEADKLRVIDRDAHTHHDQRLEHVRVIFDPVDYRFRVVTRHDTHSNWVDVCIPLRHVFTEVMKTVVTKTEVPLQYMWRRIVLAFREELIMFVASHTKTAAMEVGNWVLRKSDIQWEHTLYGAGDVTTRDLIAETTSEDPPRPFIMSYWADNYLEFDRYKMARMFNGLVGYGEFLYSRDNNYSRKAVNNFYIADMGGRFKMWDSGKKWLWADLAILTHDITTPKLETTATVIDRSSVLSAVIKDGKLSVTTRFREMVERRHVEIIRAVEEGVNTQLSKLLFPEDPTLYTQDMHDHLISHTNKLITKLFETLKDGGFEPHGLTQGDGLLDPDVLLRLCDSFVRKFHKLAANNTDGSSNFTKDDTIPVDVMGHIKAMMKASVHTAREKWLLSNHIGTMDNVELEAIQDSYKTPLWDTTHTADVGNTSNPDGRNTASNTTTSSHSIQVKNNSSLKKAYNDPAITTHALGYTLATRQNNIACDGYAIGFSKDVLQEYYDRKVHNDGAQEFIGSCDLTSILRTTHTLVKGLDRFMVSVSSAGTNNPPTPADTNKPSPPLIQTTRTPFQANGCYYVLDGAYGLYGSVNKRDSGKRRLHVDDVLTFANVMFTIVDNAGVWNLLNSGSVVNTPTDRSRAQSTGKYNSSTSTYKPPAFTPQPANIGFVNAGTEIPDDAVPNKPTNEKNSWKEIAQMTYTKLRVGVMDQPCAKNLSRTYLKEVLANTRHLSPEHVEDTFKSFIHKLYRKPCFVQSFRKGNKRKDNTTTSTGNDAQENDTSMEQQIRDDAVVLVDNLYSRCLDSGLDPHDPTTPNYAFESLKKFKIEMPKKKHEQLFYILFGETLYRMTEDLDNAVPVTDNTPQALQCQSNRMAAAHFREHLPKVLSNLTSMFFNGSLHKSLVVQLEPARARATPAVLRPLTTYNPDMWTFADVCNNPMQVICYCRIFKASRELRRSNWHNRDVSAKWTEDAIMSLLRSSNNAVRVDTPPERIPETVTEDPVATRNCYGGPSVPEDIKWKTMVTFQPYVDVYDKIKKYYNTGVEFRESTGYKPLSEEQKVLFYENRMLVTRLCEEQMHTIQHHFSHGQDYPGSMAWELLFDMFFNVRQTFAQM
ncbi:hypothetical protein T484DRAFT_1756081 [Baffinella frigidus]|nr:hypothetical protein T484DRAFT_1756081 [Cryptophyta sp. CCMP2293]